MADGLFIGRVLSVDGAGRPTVSVTDHAPGRKFGPLDRIVDVVLVVGDRVLVGLLGARNDDVVIIRKLP